MSTEEWYRSKLDELPTTSGEARIEILKEILNKLENEKSEEATPRDILISPNIFNCLNADGYSEATTLAADILKICFAEANVNETQLNLSELMERSLQHRHPQVKIFVLNEILKLIKKDPENLNIFQKPLVIKLIALTTIIETGIGAPCVQILSKLLPLHLSNVNVRAKFLELEKDTYEYVRCRFYEIVVNIARISQENLNSVEMPLRTLIFQIEGDDVLFQMNILEILVTLSEQGYGMKYLEERKVFEKMCTRVKNLSDNPLDRFMVPGYLKFFGKAAFTQPKRIIEGYPYMIIYLFDNLTSGKVDLLPTALDTLCNLTYTNIGKLTLDNRYPIQIKETFQKFGIYLRNLPSEIKNRMFNSLEEIFRLNGDRNNQLEIITRTWCIYITGTKNNLTLFLDFCRNPFPDIKVPCLSFIKVLTTYRWAQEAIKSTAGFVEYLLDRNIESEKDAKYLKFEINKILSEGNHFDGNTLNLLTRYVNEGPYYVEGIVEVATEGK